MEYLDISTIAIFLIASKGVLDILVAAGDQTHSLWQVDYELTSDPLLYYLSAEILCIG